MREMVLPKPFSDHDLIPPPPTSSSFLSSCLYCGYLKVVKKNDDGSGFTPKFNSRATNLFDRVSVVLAFCVSTRILRYDTLVFLFFFVCFLIGGKTL